MNGFDKAFEDISLLVKKFTDNLTHYMSPTYSEAEARQDFIDNFFTALGWDVSHKHQSNPYEQEVKIERSQKQQNESARKRADYAFFTGPNYKDEVFFAEAKKPSVLIENNPQHYFQTIKYGWNRGCPICVLTDFEEFAIIDCRSKPDIKYALNGKHKTYRYTDYTDKEKFAEIYWLFSREAIGNNSLQKYAADLPKPKGKVVQKALFKGSYKPVDEDFLEELDAIRENIAKAFKKANENLNSEQLTEATQRTVDRLVFIRFLEDKFIEAEEHVSHWQSWKDFISDCRKLDVKYNGVVFKKHFIDEPHFLGADEKLFLDICSDISNLNSPYDFNYIPIHILGSIYERFLGKIVIATDKRVRIEEKPEVRKAGGVYYTPKYIVDYIVKNTVGKIIEGLTPAQIAEKRFADIACGSGSFLIGVYDYLLDQHKKYYAEKLKDKTEITKSSEDYGNTEYKDGQWRLTLKLKQDILLNNIYGVDIDAQAVEVTQMSLFLKMLEEENVSSTTAKQGAMFSKVLPDLSKNIVCGNSLIGFDIMQGQLFEDEELKKLNPMDYETAFPAIMRNGGFDAVVGNPPYVGRSTSFEIQEKKYIKTKFESSQGKYELYQLFIEKACKISKRKNAFVSFITPQTWLSIIQSAKLRQLVLTNYQLNQIVFLGKGVFKASVDSILFIIQTGTKTSLIEFIEKDKHEIAPQFTFIKNIKSEDISEPDFIIPISSTEDSNELSIKLKKNSFPIENIGIWYDGVKVVGKAKDFAFQKIKFDDSFFPMTTGSDIDKYFYKWSGNYCCRSKTKIEKHKATDIRLRAEAAFQNEKILIRKTGNRIVATIDKNKNYYEQSLFGFTPSETDYKIEAILGLLNSQLGDYLLKATAFSKKETFPQIRLHWLKEFPIPKIDFKDKSQKQLHNQLATLVTQMLTAKKELAAVITDSDKNFLQNKCSSIDRQIDKLVYELYGLTEEEIKIVEGN